MTAAVESNLNGILWRQFYTDRSPFSRKYDAYQVLARKGYDRDGSWDHRLSVRRERELKRIEHDLHVRMDEVGRYLWCGACQSK